MRRTYESRNWGAAEVLDAIRSYCMQRESWWDGREFVTAWGVSPREIANMLGEAGAPYTAWPEIYGRLNKALTTLSAQGKIVPDRRCPGLWRAA